MGRPLRKTAAEGTGGYSTLARSGPIKRGGFGSTAKVKEERVSAAVTVPVVRRTLRCLELKLDDLAGAACRNRGYCELAGLDGHTCRGALTWAHIVNRDDKTLRHDPENCLCLCWSRHSELEKQPAYFETLVRSFFPGRMDFLTERRERLEGGGLDYRDRLEGWLKYYKGGSPPAFVDPPASVVLFGERSAAACVGVGS